MWTGKIVVHCWQIERTTIFIYVAILRQLVTSQSEDIRQTELSNLIPNYKPEKRHESNNALKKKKKKKKERRTYLICCRNKWTFNYMNS